jgi:hypothetical protein
MKVYHASSISVSHPDTLHSRAYLDFGPGFYVTTIERQAMDYGQRFIRRGCEEKLCADWCLKPLIINFVSAHKRPLTNVSLI